MDNNSFEQNSEAAYVSESSNKTDKHRKLVIPMVGVLGLVVGAVGAFGISKLMEKPSGDCPECNCSGQGVQVLPNDLDYSFLKLEASSTNIIYSPLSIKNGLSLLEAGASSETKDEIDKVLGGGEVPTYQNIPDVLSLANAVFIRDSYRDLVLPSYIETVQNKFKSEIIYDSFANTDKMNDWVKEKTFNLISDIGANISSDTEMILSNALAIQMDWKEEFADEDTDGRTFYKQDGTEITATTMHQTTFSKEIKYYVNDSLTALSMPLDSTSEDAKLDFIAIMPEKEVNVFIGDLTQSDIDKVLNNFISADQPEDGVEISIPKFKFDYQLSFKEDLNTLGIKLAFNKKLADFSSMAREALYVSDAIHKANIDFSEKGVKAAAVTTFVMDRATAIMEEPQPVRISINRPFVFLIRDAKNGAIWFTGAVYQPNLWEDDAESYAPSH